MKNKSREIFIQSLSSLLDEEEFPRENVSTRRFIGAMQSWLEDTDGGDGFFDQLNEEYLLWDDLYKLLQAAGMYE